MMKKLIFCLLVLTGAGVLSSCQQDEVVSEAPASKGVTIRASLPNDAQSRVMLGDTYTEVGKNYTKMCWEANDQIKVTINGTEYTFTTKESGITATFACAELDKSTTLTPGTTYTFTYGQEPTASNAQAGTKVGLKDYLYMTASYTAQNGDTWDNVSLTFCTQVALVKISLGNNFNATKVLMIDANTDKLLAATNNGNFNEVYFSVSPSSTNRKPLILVDKDDKTYFVELTSKLIEGGKFYLVSPTMPTPTNNHNIGNNNEYVKCAVYSSSKVYVYGNGGIKDSALDHMNNNVSSFTSAVILDGITSIGNYAFYQRTSLVSATIPATVEKIGYGAFKMCTNNCIIKILRNDPPELVDKEGDYDDVFGQPSNQNYQIKVPSVNNYKEHTNWNQCWQTHFDKNHITNL